MGSNENMGENFNEEMQVIVSRCISCIKALQDENEELRKTVGYLLNRDNYATQLNNYFETVLHRSFCRSLYQRNREKLFTKGYITRGKAAESNRFTGKGVVYSVITGGYDEVRELEYVNPKYDYILFSDNPQLRSETWEVRYLDNPEKLSAKKLSRKVKILPHKYLGEYDYSIYVDGKITIEGDVEEFINQYKDTRPMIMFMHYNKDCVYEEALDCIRGELDDKEIIKEQINRYRLEGMPPHNGLTENCIMVREHNDEEVIKVMETWWDEVKNHSYRDQISFGYACWRNDFLYDSTDLYSYKNYFFSLKGPAHNN